MAKITIPQIGESITEAKIVKWHKKIGEKIKIDETILTVETEKVNFDVNAIEDGILDSIIKKTGDIVKINEVVGNINSNIKEQNNKQYENSTKIDPVKTKEPTPIRKKTENKIKPNKETTNTIKENEKNKKLDHNNNTNIKQNQTSNNINKENIKTSYKEVPISNIRKTIAKHLKKSQNTQATLTTFNEFDMSNIQELRNKYSDNFIKKHGVKLSLNSFFIKAVVAALKSIPIINTQTDGEIIRYYKNYNIGIAIATEQGLVVPIIKNADQLSLPEIGKKIAQLVEKTQRQTLELSDIQDGTFSISNGGVYGSLFSTPIINSPQSAILGLHKIVDRPVIRNKKIVIRPMMYAALSYDHRIIDGAEAAYFINDLKENLGKNFAYKLAI